jgi:Peptidase family M41
MMLAGREAELQVFDSVSTGASDDLKRASELAINMVGSLGFSDALGLLSVAGVPKERLGPDIQAGVLRTICVISACVYRSSRWRTGPARRHLIRPFKPCPHTRRTNQTIRTMRSTVPSSPPPINIIFSICVLFTIEA